MPSYAYRGYASKIASANLTTTAANAILSDKVYLIHQLSAYYNDTTKVASSTVVTWSDYAGNVIAQSRIGDGFTDPNNTGAVIFIPFIAERGVIVTSTSATDIWAVVAYEESG